MENRLYLIASNLDLKKLSEFPYISNNNVILDDYLQHLYIIIYDRDTKEYIANPLVCGVSYYTYKEQNLFGFMDNNHLRFIGDGNPLGKIFQSLSAAHLEAVRWGADVAYTKYYLQQLIGD